ncbi:hypothetical protein DSM104635_03281 [Terricaulis silvestris]|uniref:Uncharacterized protein n=1 Tax=Terricaulis silvestris TaxID=2686094 RepID=A0A6I6MXQ6_9CAUL|nr:hypothetical protein DSM104635_03281 [Terricaulis silvestris]
MSNIRCKCGFVISDVSAPCPMKWRLTADDKWEDIVEGIVSIAKGKQDLARAYFLFASESLEVLKCPECSRLLIFEDGQHATFYVKE